MWLTISPAAKLNIEQNVMAPAGVEGRKPGTMVEGELPIDSFVRRHKKSAMFVLERWPSG